MFCIYGVVILNTGSSQLRLIDIIFLEVFGIIASLTKFVRDFSPGAEVHLDSLDDHK